MDGKLLILCDELPGKHNNGDDEYKIQDCKFLVSKMWYPEDLQSDKIFMTWEALIPEDRWFVEACEYYACFTDKPAPDFPIQKKGLTDPESGTLKDSLQERIYYSVYARNLNDLIQMKQKGEDWEGMALEYAVQYPFDVHQNFFDELSRILENMGVVRILPCFSNDKNDKAPDICRYRRDLLEAWNNQNKLNRKYNIGKFSSTELLPFELYSDFGEIFYVKSTDELMEIMSLPYFDIPDDKTSHEEDDGPEL